MNLAQFGWLQRFTKLPMAWRLAAPALLCGVMILGWNIGQRAPDARAAQQVKRATGVASARVNEAEEQTQFKPGGVVDIPEVEIGDFTPGGKTRSAPSSSTPKNAKLPEPPAVSLPPLPTPNKPASIDALPKSRLPAAPGGDVIPLPTAPIAPVSVPMPPPVKPIAPAPLPSSPGFPAAAPLPVTPIAPPPPVKPIAPASLPIAPAVTTETLPMPAPVVPPPLAGFEKAAPLPSGPMKPHVEQRPAAEPSTFDPVKNSLRSLENQLNSAFPESRVQLQSVGDAIIVSGSAPHQTEAANIVRALGASGAGTNVINQLGIAGAKQVLLKVHVAEVNRSAAHRAGIKLAMPGKGPCIDQGEHLRHLFALNQLRCARTLAEPNVVTLDGQMAKLDAGGQLVAAGGPGGLAVVPYGVQLAFTPTIIERDRIRLQVRASVSTRDGSAAHGAIIGLHGSSFSSTVELSEGETLAVAGLAYCQTQSRPGHFGLLKGSTDELEVMVLITPELIRTGTRTLMPETIQQDGVGAKFVPAGAR